MSIRDLFLEFVQLLEEDLKRNKQEVRAILLELNQIHQATQLDLSDDSMRTIVDNGFRRSEDMLDLLLEQIKTINLYASISDYLATPMPVAGSRPVSTEKNILLAALLYFQTKEMYEQCEVIRKYLQDHV